MRIVTIFLIALALAFSCTPTEEHNQEMWTEEEFINALMDIQITEAYMRLGFYRNKDSLILPDSIYAATFRKIGTTKEEFQKNFEYYTQQPEKMERIYDEVIVRLSEMEAQGRGVVEDSV